MLINKKFISTFILLLFLCQVKANDDLLDLDLDLDSPDDLSILTDEEVKGNDLGIDDFKTMTEDLPDSEVLGIDDSALLEESKVEVVLDKKEPLVTPVDSEKKDTNIFSVGREEKELHDIAKTMQGKIPENEWKEIYDTNPVKKYTVVKGDWLWKISKNLFGSGFYYSKVWSLNSFITNPHEIEPGMVLSFTTGSSTKMPEIKVGKITEKSSSDTVLSSSSDYNEWGDDTKPKWIDERDRLKKKKAYLQYTNENTMDDLEEASEQALNKEYEAYEPPSLGYDIVAPEEQYDSTGFDKNSRIVFNYKEGFYLNTFVSTNIVHDLGKIESAIDENTIFTLGNTIFVRFDKNVDVVVGDKFSTYVASGEVSHPNSDRKGYRYSISGQIQTIRKQGPLWECKVLETTETVHRTDRITIYTPKIDRIVPTFNKRVVEAAIIGSYNKLQRMVSFGDVVYLDRGRADGLEMGNVLSVYGFKDRATGKDIIEDPTYINGELTVITLTDNFATALVTRSIRDFLVGDIAVTKSKEDAARSSKIANKLAHSTKDKIKKNSLDELDVELNIDDLNDSLLDKADRIQFTEDELAELERQEREKSIMTEGEKDIKALERLESEIETAEKMLNEARLDEDKLLEKQSLDSIEKKFASERDESLDEIEENFGKKYLDENLNDKDNPYGLTEFDIEEIDELLNLEKNVDKTNTTHETL